MQYALVSLLALLGLFTLVNLLDELSNLGKGNYNLTAALTYVTLTIPRMIYELFPMAALLGTIIGLSILANGSELIVMRSSGVSIFQIILATLKTGAFFVVAAILIGELVSPYAETRAQRGRAETLQLDIKQHTSSGLWMRDSQTYVNVREVLPDLTLLKIKLFNFDDDRKLKSMVEATKGAFVEDQWLLDNVKTTRIDPDSARAETSATGSAKWESRVTPQILSVFLIKPEQLSFVQLNRYIQHLNENQQKTDLYELAFWNKIMLPPLHGNDGHSGCSLRFRECTLWRSGEKSVYWNHARCRLLCHQQELRLLCSCQRFTPFARRHGSLFGVPARGACADTKGLTRQFRIPGPDPPNPDTGFIPTGEPGLISIFCVNFVLVERVTGRISASGIRPGGKRSRFLPVLHRF